jgi:hypothetical protein
MDWDIGVVIYEPEDSINGSTGPDSKKVAVFLLRGGVSDYKSVDRLARVLSEKFGTKVVSMTFPGRFYFLEPSRDWPGDVENGDGAARTPLWTKETHITTDQYEIVQDVSKRESYGTIVSLAAREGTEFYYRMAAWPVAFEEAMKDGTPSPTANQVLDLHPQPLHRRTVRVDGESANSEHCRYRRLRYFALRIHVHTDRR